MIIVNFILLVMVFQTYVQFHLRGLQHGDYVTMFTKYHGLGGVLGVAAGPDSVAFFLKTKPKEEKKWFFISPLKMLPILIWYFTQETERSPRSDVDTATDRTTD